MERVTDLKLDEYTDFLSWRDDEDIRRIIEFYLRHAGLAPYYDAVAPIIWKSLTTDVLDGVCIGRLNPDDRLHEVDFHFPFDKTKHQVMLNGSIDVAFRCLGRYYFADWKSDTLKDYRPAALRKKVNEEYVVQYQIYLWAMLRWLRIENRQQYEERFGGFFYLFIRGMGEGAGIYYHRPDWETVSQYEAKLKSRT